MKKIFFFLCLSFCVISGMAASTYVFRNESQIFFHYLKSRVESIQGILIKRQFTSGDLLFFGDSVVARGLDPRMLDQNIKWNKTFNFALPNKSIDLNVRLLKWFNDELFSHYGVDVSNVNVVFQFSVLQLDAKIDHDNFIDTIAEYNPYRLDEYSDVNPSVRIFTKLWPVESPFLPASYSRYNLLHDVGRLNLIDQKYFSWIDFVFLILSERWNNRHLLNTPWNSESRGFFDFDEKENFALLNKIKIASESPRGQAIFYRFWKGNVCTHPVDTKAPILTELLTQLKSAQTRVKNLTVILAPVSQVLYNGEDCERQVQTYVNEIRSAGLVVLDYSHAVEKNNFMDFIHLNSNGMLLWANLLRADLNARLSTTSASQ